MSQKSGRKFNAITYHTNDNKTKTSYIQTTDTRDLYYTTNVHAQYNRRTQKQKLKKNKKIRPEGHSVERMYLRQRLSDASVNKTILKPRLAPKTTPPIRVRGIFPDIKFHVAALIRYLRKQSGSGIGTIIQIGLKS